MGKEEHSLFPPEGSSDEEKELWYTNLVEKEYSTSGHKKFVRYMEAIFQTDEYRELIETLRKEHRIPLNGFKPTPDADGSSGYIFPVREWQAPFKERKTLNQEIKKFCMKHHLHYMDVLPLIDLHLFYNVKFDPSTLTYDLGSFNLFHISDLVVEKEEPYGKDYQDSDDMAYPIAIRISPYASLRDILDFIKKVYSHSIAPLQKNYRDSSIKLGASRRRKDKIKERNIFIYENKQLPRKKIMQLVNERFGEVLDYGHIGKIISIEERKRKEV